MFYHVSQRPFNIRVEKQPTWPNLARSDIGSLKTGWLPSENKLRLTIRLTREHVGPSFFFFQVCDLGFQHHHICYHISHLHHHRSRSTNTSVEVTRDANLHHAHQHNITQNWRSCLHNYKLCASTTCTSLERPKTCSRWSRRARCLAIVFVSECERYGKCLLFSFCHFLHTSAQHNYIFLIQNGSQVGLLAGPMSWQVATGQVVTGWGVQMVSPSGLAHFAISNSISSRCLIIQITLPL